MRTKGSRRVLGARGMGTKLPFEKMKNAENGSSDGCMLW